MKTNVNLSKIVSSSIALILCFAVLVFALTGLHWAVALPAHACATPSIASSPTSGPVGTAVTVTGSGIVDSNCNPLSSATVTFGYSPSNNCSSLTAVSSTATITNGSFSGTFTWPSSGTTAGTTYIVCAQISGVSGTLAANTFQVTTSSSSVSVSVDSSSYKVGDNITVTGAGFPASTSVTVEEQSANGATTTTLGNVTTDTTGAFTQDYTVPPQPLNSVVIIATAGSVKATSSTFTVIPPPPSNTSTPTSGPVGTTITVTGSNTPPPAGSATETVTFGYSPNSNCNLFYSVGTGSNPKVSNGSFTGTFTWPSSGTKIGTTYTVCVQMNNVSGGGTLTLPSSSFLVIPPPPSITSSPTSGPVGTTITVTSSNIPSPAGSSTIETVTFGYSPSTDCNLFYSVGTGSNPKVSHGSFTGTFIWPSSGTSVGTTYTVCAQINNVSGGGTLTLAGNTFLVTK